MLNLMAKVYYKEVQDILEFIKPKEEEDTRTKEEIENEIEQLFKS